MTLNEFQPPLVAILRGLPPGDAVEVGLALVDAGFRMIEVPLNRPGALEAIALLAKALPPGVLLGGGTMLTTADVDAVLAAGGRLMVAPDCKPAVIAHARASGMFVAPGIMTPSEAFAALDAGAHALKIFPSAALGAEGLKALLSVLPAGTPVWPVGGIAPDNIAAWRRAGATGFGIGGQLYPAGARAAEVGAAARRFIEAWAASRA
jgi:2-dehydro-3-deoxyphosphogalactonate aldolase